MLAIVLSRRNFREHDQLISLLTAEKGKIIALAKGVKKITSKNSAYLEPFFLIETGLIPGREMIRLGSVRPVEIFRNIRMDMVKSWSASATVNLLNKILGENEPDKRIFSVAKSFLFYIDRAKSVKEILLDAYAVKILYLLGFDISSDKKFFLQRKKLLNLVTLSWQAIAGLRIELSERVRLHKLIYNFALFHCERKLFDWGTERT